MKGLLLFHSEVMRTQTVGLQEADVHFENVLNFPCVHATAQQFDSKNLVFFDFENNTEHF